MKIFQVTTFYHPITGGVESHVASLAHELKELGHEVTILTSDSSKVGPRIKVKDGQFEGIFVKRFFTWFSLSQYHRFYPALFFYLLSHDFDIVHVHGFRKFETYLALWAAKIKHRKIVLTSHNPFPTTTRSKLSEMFVKIHDATLGKWFTRSMDKIITILKSENEIFETKFKVPKEKIKTVFNGLNPIFLQDGKANEFYSEYGIKREEWDSIVVAGGRMNYAKGFQFLKKAVKSLPNVLFFIAGGDDGYLSTLKQIYYDLPNIIFNGKYLPQDKLINIYAGGDIFVLPSIHEATGGMMLEALSQGCDIIATNQGGTIEYLGKDFGTFIKPDDEDAWLEEIQKRVGKTKKTKVRIQKAKDFLQNYRWDNLTNKINQIYKSL